MEERERRQALAAFLRTHRARLSTAEVGLPARRRHRTPGLRREDVAELANIAVSWYTLLEQGKDIHPSKPVLESIAQALRLTHVEEKYLFLLAGYALPVKAPAEEEEVSPELQRVVDVLTPHPAFVIGRRWDVLFRNPSADLVFCFDEPFPPPLSQRGLALLSDARTLARSWLGGAGTQSGGPISYRLRSLSR